MIHMILSFLRGLTACMPICFPDYPDSTDVFGLLSEKIQRNRGFTHVQVAYDTMEYQARSKDKARCSERGELIRTTATFSTYGPSGAFKKKTVRVKRDSTPDSFDCPFRSKNAYRCVTKQKDTLSCGDTATYTELGAAHYRNDCQSISMKIGTSSEGLIFGEISPKDSVKYRYCAHFIDSTNWVPILDDTILISKDKRNLNIPVPSFFRSLKQQDPQARR
ncbi:MAG: hypothetical protein IPK50_14605 [Fibrobacterota bacterium]|nr:MAG: hypothetical protein IPK50_14605 [Fibrobacterota bacterium]